MQANFFDTIRQMLLLHAGRVLVVWPGGSAEAAGTASYTGQAILNRVQGVRAALAAAGVRPGQPVLLALPVGMDLVSGLLGAMALGAVAVLPPAAASRLGIFRLVRRSRIRAVVLQQPLPRVGRLVAAVFGIRLVAINSLPNTVATEWAAAALVAADQAALVSHSSGSTGQAKAIRRSHRVLQAQHEAIKAVFPPLAGQHDFPLFPNILLHNLAAGVVSILPDVPWTHLPHLDAARVVQQLRQQSVHTLTGNVCYFRALLAHLRQHPAPLPGVVGVGVGGSPVPEPLVQELKRYFPNAAVHVIYGSSEAEPIAVREVGAAPAPPAAGYCVGAIHPALECRLRPLGQLRTGEAVGEVQVRGPHVAVAAGEWLSTGDYGYFRGGQLYLTGRQGNERLHQGVQHYQLEHAVCHVPGVEQVAARADADGFTLFVQGRASEAAVAQCLAEVFPAGICRAILFRAALPVDARHHSKFIYAQLR